MTVWNFLLGNLGLDSVTQNFSPNLSASECDYIWRKGLQRDDLS